MRRSRSLRLICVAVGFYPIHVKTSGSESHRERNEKGIGLHGEGERARRKKELPSKNYPHRADKPRENSNFDGEKVFRAAWHEDLVHRHWEGGWERRNEVTGWGLVKEKKKKKRKAEEKKRKREEVWRKSGTGRSRTICQNPANDL